MTVNTGTANGALTLLAASVAVIVQSEYVAFAKAPKVILLAPVTIELVALEQEPQTTILADSLDVNQKLGV